MRLLLLRRTMALLWLAWWIACAFATLRWLQSIPIGQDVQIYEVAAARAREGLSPYLPIDIGGEGYTYHPAQLLLVRVLAPRGQGLSWSWFAASVAAWLATLWLIANCLARGLRASLPEPRWLWLIAALTFGPLVETLYLGQIDTMVTMATLLALWFLLRDVELSAGVSLAVAIVLKASPVLLLAHLAAWRRWTALVAAIGSLAILTLIPAVVYSPRLIVEYRQVVSAISNSLPPAFYNQSPISVVYRAVRVIAPQASPLMRNLGGPLAGILSAVVLLPLIRRRPTPPLTVCSFVAVWIVALVASPLVWYHHHLFLVAAIAMMLSSTDRTARWLAVAGASSIQMQRVIELAGGSRWLGAVAGELAIAAGAAGCLWRLLSAGSPQGAST